MILADDRKCSHPEFRYCAIGARPFVFVFDRPRFKTPTPKQIAEYQANEKIVKAHGGVMLRSEYELAGENPTLTAQDVHEAVKQVLLDNPDLELVDTWNGIGCYTLSVGCRLKAK